eukprot:gene8746-11818_t
MKFIDLKPKLSDETLFTVESFGFVEMTPVQSSTIPLFLSNKDCCVEAVTGSGKTLAFGIPIFEIIKSKHDEFGLHTIGALVLAPTRELATQIFEVFSKFCLSHQNVRCALFVGGTSVEETALNFQKFGAQVVIGTPGRILDLNNRKELFNFRKLEILVLDEADTLLDMGFRDAINQILQLLPKQRRTALFSATQTKEIKDLARAGMRNPVSISVKVQNNTINHDKSSQAIPTTLQNYFINCEHNERPVELAHFLIDHHADKVIVFCATCACVDYYSLAFSSLVKKSKVLPSMINVIGFHGKMNPKKRNLLYQKFLSLSSGVMFTTDVAARGIDIPDIDWIVQLAAPKDPAFFVHRIGRTARAGKLGGAILYVTPEEIAYIELLRGRGVPLIEKPKYSVTNHNNNADEENESLSKYHQLSMNLIHEMKKLSMNDRELLESGSTAFMSFLKAYKEHICSFIFRFDRLDIGNIANGYALLKLPKIPETRGVKGLPIKFENTRIDTSTIPYLHHEKEKARVRKLAASKTVTEEQNRVAFATASIKSSGTKPWIPTESFQNKEEIENKRQRKKKLSTHQKIMSEWDELAAEEMAYKKFKKGKLSKTEYEHVFDSDRTMEIDEVLNGKSKNIKTHMKESDLDNASDESDGDDSDGEHENPSAKNVQMDGTRSIAFSTNTKFSNRSMNSAGNKSFKTLRLTKKHVLAKRRLNSLRKNKS